MCFRHYPQQQLLQIAPHLMHQFSNIPGCSEGTVTVSSDLSGPQTFDLCDNTGSILQTWTGNATSHAFTGIVDGTYKGKVTLGSCVSELSLATTLSNSLIPFSICIKFYLDVVQVLSL